MTSLALRKEILKELMRLRITKPRDEKKITLLEKLLQNEEEYSLTMYETKIRPVDSTIT